MVRTVALSGFNAGWYPTDACFDLLKVGLFRFIGNMTLNFGPKTKLNCIVLGLSHVDDNYKNWHEATVEQFPMGRVPEVYSLGRRAGIFRCFFP